LALTKNARILKKRYPIFQAIKKKLFANKQKQYRCLI
jgi:hypothetical protein